MKTNEILISNNERIFLVQKLGSTNVITCNLEHVPNILKDILGEGEEAQVYHIWNLKIKKISKRHLLDMFYFNGVDYMQEFKVNFEGRKRNAIGKAVKFRGVKVMAENRDKALLCLYKDYDHIVNVKIVR